MTTRIVFDGAVVVGAGLAGLTTAISMAPLPCIVLSAGALTLGTSTGWAQGGVAAAVGSGDDPRLHAEDTVAAGAGLCEPDVVASVTADAPAAIRWLDALGARFDRAPDGSFLLGLEGAHSRRRIVHACGDATGAELLRTVTDAARALPSIALWEQAQAVEIVVGDGRVAGVHVVTPTGDIELRTDTVVLATGGVGGLFTHTTNPLSSRGQGLALAFRAGATLRDVEMVQFHPTALDVGIDPMPLVSEAVRGEGALLVNELGTPVLRNPLSARDVVARANWAQLQAGHRVYLDARTHPGEHFPVRFPSIHAKAVSMGLDPRADLIPVRPAAHYHMGGVLVGERGESTVPGLFAVGEVASTGLHGANRLASNSLLEAVVYGRRVGRHLASTRTAGGTPPARPAAGARGAEPEASDPTLKQIREALTQGAGVLRDAASLHRALDLLRPHRDTDAGLVAYLLAWSALQREESRGAHTRLDAPATHAVARHTLVAPADLLEGSRR